MRYRIEYAGGKCCNFANNRKDLIEWLKLLKDEPSRISGNCIKAVSLIRSWIFTSSISAGSCCSSLMNTDVTQDKKEYAFRTYRKKFNRK